MIELTLEPSDSQPELRSVEPGPFASQSAQPAPDRRASATREPAAPAPSSQPGLTGTVVDAFAQPVPHARIVAKIGAPVAESVTDSKGRFSVTVSRGRYSVTVTARGYARRVIDGSAPDSNIRVELVPEALIAGQVVRRTDGHPAPYATVVARTSSEWRRSSVATTQADAEGRFLLHALEPGEYELSAAGSGWASRDPVVIGVDALGLHDGVQLAVEPAQAVTGTLRYKATEAACPDGIVRVDGMNDRFVPLNRRVKATQGSFRIPDLPPGSYNLDASCGDLDLPGGERTVVVGASSPAPIVLEFSRPASVCGRVLDESETPVVGAVVLAYQDDNKWPSRARTDDAGRYCFEPLEPGAYTIQTDRDPEAYDANLADGEVDDDFDFVETLEPPEAPPRLRGVVLDETGAPYLGLVVSCANGDLMMRLFGGGDPTSETGAFDASLVDPCKLSVQDSRGGRIDVLAGLPSGGRVAAEHMPLTLICERPTGVITGRVVSSTGEPLSHIAVVATEIDTSPRPKAATAARTLRAATEGPRAAPVYAMTDDDGRFEIQRIVRGEYEVVARQFAEDRRVVGRAYTGDPLTLVMPN